MSIYLTTPERIAEVEAENPGTHIEVHTQAQTLLVGDLFYVAPLDAA